jgi:hypothetical protein
MANSYTTIWRRMGCTAEYKQMPKGVKVTLLGIQICSRIFRGYIACENIRFPLGSRA